MSAREELIYPAASTESFPERTSTRDAAEARSPNLVVYRDPDDVRTIFQLLSSLIVILALFCLSAFGNAVQYWRRPDRIVVDKSNGRVLMINDRQYGETDSVKLMSDRPMENDKKYLVGEYVRALYAINPATRAGDIKAALEMMVPNSATKFATYLKEQHVLEQQRAESWQAVWSPQDMTIDRVDPYTVRVLGKQEVTKVVNNQVMQETKQLQLTVKLVADPAGRTDQNKRMGFLVAAIDYKEIGS
ncbi:MAG: hypothetical protein ABI977_33045 [Acidobacteriota bacterium]